MKATIPLEIAELALENKDREINELKKEISEIKNAGFAFTLKIHKSKTFAEFYPELAEFEKRLQQ